MLVECVPTTVVVLAFLQENVEVQEGKCLVTDPVQHHGQSFHAKVKIVASMTEYIIL